jgi:hypothetical protein
MSMSRLPIVTADQRLAEPRGIKGCIFGGSGIGKTSLLWTLDPERTLFMDLEAGDVAIEGWQGDTIRPRTWMDCRDFAVFIGGPNPSLRGNSFQDIRCAVTILNTGAVDLETDEQPDGIGHDMTLAPLILFPASYPLTPPLSVVFTL